MIYLVSRQQETVDALRSDNVAFDKIISHFNPAIVKPGDVVLASLPLPIAAKVCAKGGIYKHVEITRPANIHGDLTSAEILKYGYQINQYDIIGMSAGVF